jgi:hypothetical protein
LTTVLGVVLGSIIAVATPTSAQSLPEQRPSASGKTKDALGTGKDQAANPMSTLDHIDSIKDKAEGTNKDGANPWGPVPTEKASLANLAPVLLPLVFGLPGTLLVSICWPVGFALSTTYFIFISRRYAGKVSIKWDTQGFY